MKLESMKCSDLWMAYTCYTESVVASTSQPIMASSAQNAMVNLSSRDGRFCSFSISLYSSTQMGGTNRHPTRTHKVLRAAGK